MHVIHIILFYTGGIDYDPGPYSILFSAGETNKSFNISIFDNNTFESLENFNLLISPHAFILLGNPHQAVTTIRDDDGKNVNSMFSIINVGIAVVIINFVQPTYTVTEDSGSAQAMLALSNPSIFDITIQITDMNSGLTGITM